MHNIPHWLHGSLKEVGEDICSRYLERIEETPPQWLKRFPEKPPEWLGKFLDSAPPWLKELWIESGFLDDDPRWIHEIRTRFRANIARTFILHFNVRDYVFHPDVGYCLLIDYLSKKTEGYKIVLFYSRSAGVSFPEGGERKEEEIKTIVKRALEEDNILTSSELASRSSPSQVLHQIEELFAKVDQLGSNQGSSCAAIIDFAEKIVPVFQSATPDEENLLATEIIERFALNLSAKKHIMILLTSNISDLAASLRRSGTRIEQIEIPLPDYKDRLKFISYHIFDSNYSNTTGDKKIEFDSEFPGETNTERLKAFASLTQGLPRTSIEDIILRTRVDVTNPEISENLIKEERERVIKDESGGLLEIVTTENSFSDVGGLEMVKNDLRQIARDIKNNRIDFVPMGVLFLGPPGTGKSIMAEAFAKESGLAFVKFGKIRSMWVGESESNMSRALQLIRALSPVVVFVDEIDQWTSQRGDQRGSEESGRIFGQVLQFMSDSSLRGRVLWIGASNRPDLLDPAFKRPGRFDEKFPFFIPNEEEQKKIFKALFNKGKPPTKIDFDKDVDDILQRMKDYTGAEIEVIVSRSRKLCRQERGDEVTKNHLMKVLEDFIPSRDETAYEFMTLLTVSEINRISYLPDEFKEEAKDEEGRRSINEKIAKLKRRLMIP